SLAVRYSRFIRAILVSLIPTGHSASQAPVLVQLPKPSASIWSTMACARLYRSVWPWGNKAYCDILADTNSMAEEFLQAATQAPQPMQVADSNASSATTFGDWNALCNGNPAGIDIDKPAGLLDPVECGPIHRQDLDYWKSRGPPRFDDDRLSIMEASHMKLAGGGQLLWTMWPAIDIE